MQFLGETNDGEKTFPVGASIYTSVLWGEQDLHALHTY